MGWIRVKNKLPPENEDILWACEHHDSPSLGRYINGKWYFVDMALGLWLREDGEVIEETEKDDDYPVMMWSLENPPPFYWRHIPKLPKLQSTNR